MNNYTRFSGDLVGGTELTVLERPKVQEKPEHPLENVKFSILISGAVFFYDLRIISTNVLYA